MVLVFSELHILNQIFPLSYIATEIYVIGYSQQAREQPNKGIVCMEKRVENGQIYC